MSKQLIPTAGYQPDITAPADQAATVTKSDTVNLTYPARSLYVGSAGDLWVVPYGASTSGTPVPFISVAAGTILPIMVWRVQSTSSSASSIIALY